MITPVFTTPWAQWSYDTAREDGISTDQEVMIHGYLQVANALSHTAIPISMTRMSNPHILSYGYAGISAERHGIAAAMADRKAFQRASSAAFKVGEDIGYHLGAHYHMGDVSKKALAKRHLRGKAMAKIGGRIASRAIPGLGWALLAYDAYDLVANQRLFGVQL